jgi:hypothetical protein
MNILHSLGLTRPPSSRSQVSDDANKLMRWLSTPELLERSTINRMFKQALKYYLKKTDVYKALLREVEGSNEQSYSNLRNCLFDAWGPPIDDGDLSKEMFMKWYKEWFKARFYAIISGTHMERDVVECYTNFKLNTPTTAKVDLVKKYVWEASHKTDGKVIIRELMTIAGEDRANQQLPLYEENPPIYDPLTDDPPEYDGDSDTDSEGSEPQWYDDEDEEDESDED